MVGDKVQPHKDIKVRISALLGGFLYKPGLSSPAMLSKTTLPPNISILSIMLVEPQGLFMLPLLGSMVSCLMLFHLKSQSHPLRSWDSPRKAKLWRKISGHPLSWICCSDFWKICHRDACSSLFTATLFKIAKVWKQPRFPATGEWIRKMQHRYIGTLFQL